MALKRRFREAVKVVVEGVWIGATLFGYFWLFHLRLVAIPPFFIISQFRTVTDKGNPTV